MADDGYYSINDFPGNGTQTTFEVSFAGGYISRSHISARLFKDLDKTFVDVTFTWVNQYTIKLDSAPLAGYTLRVYRSTPVYKPLVDYSDGALLNEVNLDTANKQAIFAAAEALDAFGTVPGNDALRDATAALVFARARSNHTGTQDISTVAGLSDLLNNIGPAANRQIGWRSITDVVLPSELAAFLAGTLAIDMLLTRMFAIGGSWRIPHLGFAYEMKNRVLSGIPSNFTLIVDSRATIRYTGAVPLTTAGLFEPENADNFTITSDQPFEAATFEIIAAQTGTVYLVFAYKCANLKVKDITVKGGHVLHTAPSKSVTTSVNPYAGVILDGPNANVCKNARAIRTKSIFESNSLSGQGSVFFWFCDGGTAIGCEGVKCGSVVQSWGGDAAFTANGLFNPDPVIEATRLKCRDITVRNIKGTATTNTWVFFCMTEHGAAYDCTGNKCGDVGFDAEGCKDIVWSNCWGKDSAHGNYSVYFYSDNVRMVGCQSFLSKGNVGRHTYINNPSQLATYSGGFEWKLGHIETLDATGQLGLCTADACMMMTFEGCRFIQSAVSAVANNLFRVRVDRNSFHYPRSLPSNTPAKAIEVSGAHSVSGMSPSIIVKDNVFSTNVAQGSVLSLIEITNDEPFLAALIEVRGNRGVIPIPGGFSGIGYTQNGATAGRLQLEQNRVEGPIVLRRGGPSGSPYPLPVLTLGPTFSVNVSDTATPINRSISLNTNLDTSGNAITPSIVIVNP